MVLNRISRKEAESSLSRLRRPVTLQVFTLGYESAACRETRQAAEELAEMTSRLSVDVCDAFQAGDLLRKFRVEEAPCVACVAKETETLRLYGAPTGFALPILLDALASVGTVVEPRQELADALAGPGPGGVMRMDLIVSRHRKESVEAAAALWRVAVLAPWTVASVRIIEDQPWWAGKLGSADLPALFLEEKPVHSWPFSDLDLARIASGTTDVAPAKPAKKRSKTE